MSRVLVGLDLGTTYFKALAIDEGGRPLASAAVPTPATDEGEGRVSYDPRAVWEAVCGLLRSVTQEAGGEVTAVACSSMGEAGFLLDARGRPLGPAIAWFDPRTHEEARLLQQQVGGERIRSITGLSADFTYSLAKILWLRRNQPEAFQLGRKWVGMSEWVAYRLSGVAATDYTLASRTMALDLRQEAWSQELLDLAGVDMTLLPPVHPSGTVLGPLRAEAADETGLSTRTQVCVGGHDHLCAAFAAGATDQGVLLDSCGTTETFLAALDRIGLDKALANPAIAVGHHIHPGRYYAMTTLRTSGLSVDWFAAQVLNSEPRSPAGLASRAAEVPPGARGVLFYPYLRDASDDRHAAGSAAVVVGLRDYHTNADLARALLEGLSFEARRMLDRLQPVLNTRPTVLRAVGGSTRNATWQQIKADVMGVPLEVLGITEASAYGAALLAGVGVGALRGAERASVSAVFAPDPTRHAEYEGLYRRYLAVLPVAIRASALSTGASE